MKKRILCVYRNNTPLPDGAVAGSGIGWYVVDSDHPSSILLVTRRDREPSPTMIARAAWLPIGTWATIFFAASRAEAQERVK